MTLKSHCVFQNVLDLFDRYVSLELWHGALDEGDLALVGVVGGAAHASGLGGA